jgi:hypothetical protein
MYLIYKDNPTGYFGFSLLTKKYFTALTIPNVVKGLHVQDIGASTTFGHVTAYTNKQGMDLVCVYDENLKEIPAATFINDYPELFI